MSGQAARALAAPRARLHTRGRSIERISSGPDLERLKPEWDELLENSGSGGIFLTWEWLSAWSEHLLSGELCVLAVREEGRLIGLAPFVQEPLRVLGVLPWTRLRFLGTGTAGSDYLDVILRRGSERQAIPLMADYLAALGAPVELGQLREGPGGSDVMAGTLHERGWAVSHRDINVCPWIPLQGLTWESYLSTLGSEHRYNVNRRIRNLNRKFRVELRLADDDARRREALRVLLSLHARRWNGRGGSDAFTNEAIERFHEDVTRRALDRGWLRLFTLMLDGEPAAALYGFSHNGVFSFYQSGLDPRFASHSVGLVLMGLCIRSALEEGLGEFDMLHGAERYKYLWARRSRTLRRITLTPPGPAGACFRAVMRLRRKASAAAGHLLPVPVLRRIAWWRGTAVPATDQGSRA